MKSYHSIEKNVQDYLGQHIFAFDKIDGSNFRAEWDRKTSKKQFLSHNGFSKFGTRTQLIGTSDPFTEAVDIFMDKYSEPLDYKFNNDKIFRGVDKITVYSEFFGPSSFAGQHNWEEEHDVTMFDMFLYKKDFLKPRDFIDLFEHLGIPDLVYEGPLNESFIKDIVSNYYDLKEGVVIKGVSEGKVFMSKIKTQKWLDEVREKYGVNNNIE